jgi:hypothetical protein
MSTPTIVTGKITGYAGIVGLPDGTQGYTTGSVSYTIRATIPGLTQPVEFNGQKPEVRLWPENQEINVEALVNKSCIGVMVNNDIRWHFFEPPIVAGCASTTGRPSIDPEIIREEEIRTRAEAAGGAPSAGGTPTGGPGGVE